MIRSARLLSIALCTLGLAFQSALLVAAEPAAAAPAAAAAAGAFVPLEGAVPASKVTDASVGQEVVVVGQVQSVKPSEGERVPTRLTLSEASGKTFQVVYWPDLAATIEGGKGTPAEGTAVSAKGTVDQYRDTLQIKIKDAAQIRIAGVTQDPSAAPAPKKAAPEVKAAAPVAAAPAAQATPAAGPTPGADGYFTVDQLGALKTSHLNKEVSIKATIASFTEARNDRAPHVIMIGSGDNKSEVVYWGEDKTTYAKVGSTIYATGLLQEYKERMQIKLADMDHISFQPLAAEFMAKEKIVATPATGPATHWPGAPKRETNPEFKKISVPAGTAMKLNQISSAHEGNHIKVAGKVFSAAPGPSGTTSVILSADGAMLTVIIRTAAGVPKAGEQVEAEGDLIYNKLRSEPELLAAGLTKVEAKP